MTNAIMAAQSTNSSVSSVEKAVRSNNLVFGGYILAGVMVLVLAFLSWKSGNRLQSAIKADADARIAEAHAAASQANARAAELESKNLALAASLADTERAIRPRDLPQIAFSEKMKPFAGTKAVVKTIPDFETRRTAELIASTLRIAGWQVPEVLVKTDASQETLFEFSRSGVTVRMNPDFERIASMSRQETDGLIAKTQRLMEVREALVKELNDSGVIARKGASASEVSSDTLLILVSLKPIPGEMTQERGNKFFIAPGSVPPTIVIAPDPPRKP